MRSDHAEIYQFCPPRMEQKTADVVFRSESRVPIPKPSMQFSPHRKQHKENLCEKETRCDNSYYEKPKSHDTPLRTLS